MMTQAKNKLLPFNNKIISCYWVKHQSLLAGLMLSHSNICYHQAAESLLFILVANFLTLQMPFKWIYLDIALLFIQ